MRIIAGRWKGARISAPKGVLTRPTTDRVKEAVFSILGDRTIGASVLDLCAGSGSLGLEALSRGADSAVFVDKGTKALALIRENCAKVRAENVRIVREDAFRYVKGWNWQEQPFTLIFFDPPYRGGLYQPVLKAIDESPILCEGGLVVVEHGRNEDLPRDCLNLMIVDNRRYGDTQISLFSRQRGDS